MLVVYLYHHFNSRPHGGRQVADTAIFLSSISTHALTEGDVDKVPIIPTPSISTHALTEGDSFQKPPEALKRSFQLTPSRRATERCRRSAPAFSHFNSRPHGGRRTLSRIPLATSIFQLTPSRRATANLDKFFF